MQHERERAARAHRVELHCSSSGGTPSIQRAATASAPRHVHITAPGTDSRRPSSTAAATLRAKRGPSEGRNAQTRAHARRHRARHVPPGSGSLMPEPPSRVNGSSFQRVACRSFGGRTRVDRGRWSCWRSSPTSRRTSRRCEFIVGQLTSSIGHLRRHHSAGRATTAANRRSVGCPCHKGRPACTRARDQTVLHVELVCARHTVHDVPQ